MGGALQHGSYHLSEGWVAARRWMRSGAVRVLVYVCGVLVLGLTMHTAGAAAYVTFVQQWGASGTGVGQFGNQEVGALTVGPGGTVYAIDPANERVNMFSADGAVIGSFGTADHTNGNTPANGAFDSPIGVAATPGGDVYVLDAARNPPVQRFDSQGDFESQFPASANGCIVACSQPTAIAVAPDGDVLVLEGAATRVDRYSSDGHLLQTWGGNGSGPGQFACTAPVSYCVGGPQGIAVGPDGLIYVADTYNNRIEVFSEAGAFQRQWTVPVDEDDNGLQPKSIAVAPDGEVYVSGDSWSSVDAFSASGQLDDQFGKSAFPGCSPGEDSCPQYGGNGDVQFVSGLGVGPRGDAYVGGENPSVFPWPPAIGRFRRGDSGTPAPGSLSATDVSGTLSLRSQPAPASCSVHLQDYPWTIRDCTGFVRATLTFSSSCAGVGGVPGWGASLAYADAQGDFYRPVGLTSPTFVPAPPHRDPATGDWLLTDGTDLGFDDPSSRPVLEFGTAGTPVSGHVHSVSAIIQPGVAVRATMRTTCTYLTSDGYKDNWGIDLTGATLTSAPRLVWQPGPHVIGPGQKARLHVALIYSGVPSAPAPKVTFSVSGAGIRQSSLWRQGLATLPIHPRRGGTITVSAGVGGTRAANRLRLVVRARGHRHPIHRHRHRTKRRTGRASSTAKVTVAPHPN